MISKIRPLYTKSINLDNNISVVIYFYAIKRFKNIHIKYYDNKLCCFFNNEKQLNKAMLLVDNNYDNIQKLYERHIKKVKLDDNFKWVIILNQKFKVINHINPHLSGYGYKLQNNELIIDSQRDINLYKEDVIKTILQEIARNVINEIIQIANKKMNLNWKKVEFGFYKRFWGSYTHQKQLLKFSYNLIHYEYEVIHYVVVHELAHIVYQNHSKEFWEFVALYCPNYKNFRHILKVS